jgi:hypothetical protein
VEKEMHLNPDKPTGKAPTGNKHNKNSKTRNLNVPQIKTNFIVERKILGELIYELLKISGRRKASIYRGILRQF